MNKITDQTKVINANQNFEFAWTQDDFEKYSIHIPTATWLIQKYSTQWFKNHPETIEYQMLQFGLCLSLSASRGSREWTLDFIAFRLGCNPLALINDLSPELKDVT